MTTPANAPYKLQQQQARAAGRYGFLREPSLQDRIRRLNPAERAEVRQIINSLKLRKIVRRILAEAYWEGQAQLPLGPDAAAMEKLRQHAITEQAMEEYQKHTSAEQTYEPQITTSNEAPSIIVPA